MIWLREDQGFDIKFIIQVDTLCHKIPNFIEKASRAGVTRAFIGLENINPDSLLGAKKRQNRITDYRAMLQAWKSVGVLTYAGYIIGFPNDRKETVLRDIEISSASYRSTFWSCSILRLCLGPKITRCCTRRARGWIRT